MYANVSFWCVHLLKFFKQIVYDRADLVQSIPTRLSSVLHTCTVLKTKTLIILLWYKVSCISWYAWCRNVYIIWCFCASFYPFLYGYIKICFLSTTFYRSKVYARSFSTQFPTTVSMSTSLSYILSNSRKDIDLDIVLYLVYRS